MARRWSLPEGEKLGIGASYEPMYPLAFVVVANIWRTAKRSEVRFTEGSFGVSERVVGVVHENDLLAISVDHGLGFSHLASDRAGGSENTSDRVIGIRDCSGKQT